MRRILMLLNSNYPSDIRVKKEADALINAGNVVNLICLRGLKEEYTEDYQGINIIRIDAGKNNYGLAFWDVVMSIGFIHPRFKKAILKVIDELNIEAIHVHDLPLAGTALSVKNRKKEIKVVIDLHENYPEALKTWFKWKKNPFVRLKNTLFLNPKRWTEFERQECVAADRVVAVVDEMKKRLVKNYNIEPNKISVITNTEDKNFLQQKLDTEVYSKIPEGFRVTYCGGIGPHRGVDTVIQAMNHLSRNDIQLVIVGSGSKSVMDNLMALRETLNLKNVHFLGYQPFSKFYSYMHFADVNIIPHKSNGHTNNTVPHKLFQGMMAGRPLLVSTCDPLKRLVEAYECGVVFEADNPENCAKMI
ncbi:MAG: glycosyltransferase family 4 protein, partial [Cyclobacteriaceae bacterium]